MHPALLHEAHRPWPLPARPWLLTMDWEDLLFAHWRVEPERLQRLLPAGLQVETFDGAAWLGVVPFRMSRTRLRWLPPLATAHAFPELNVRTYVRAGEVPGVWFFSLDAASRLAVAGARAGFGLPYFFARMRCARAGDEVHCASERRDRRGPAAAFAASWRATGDAAPAQRGSLEHFLAERYCLFAVRRGRLVRCDIAHAPWQLAPAAARIDACDMTRLLGLELAGPPASLLATRPLRVAAWSPTRVAP
jgi:uncharacterized protein YqjF (DUF2071 family)